MKKIFFIQGLAGLSSEKIMSEIFIINKNTNKDPIIAFSTYDLLFNNDLEGDFSGLNPIDYDEKTGRNYNDFISFLENAKLSIHTTLSISKLLTLYGG